MNENNRIIRRRRRRKQIKTQRHSDYKQNKQFVGVCFFGCSIVIMHIIFSSRRQNIKKHQQRPWRRQHRTMSSLLFYASILQIFAHGLNAQLLSEKIPLGKSFRHSYRIALPFLLFGYSVFIVGTYIRIIKKDFLSPLLRRFLFFISLLLVSVIFVSTLVFFLLPPFPYNVF